MSTAIVKEGKIQTYLQVGQIDTVFRVMLLAQEQVPQPTRSSLLLELFHYRDNGGPSFFKGVFGKLSVV
jgi:hypothetical protein